MNDNCQGKPWLVAAGAAIHPCLHSPVMQMSCVIWVAASCTKITLDSHSVWNVDACHNSCPDQRSGYRNQEDLGGDSCPITPKTLLTPMHCCVPDRVLRVSRTLCNLHNTVNKIQPRLLTIARVYNIYPTTHQRCLRCLACQQRHTSGPENPKSFGAKAPLHRRSSPTFAPHAVPWSTLLTA